MRASRVIVGLDLGTSTCKALALDPFGVEVALARMRTPWHEADGTLAMSAAEVTQLVHDLLGRLGAQTGGASISAIGVTGFAESGFLFDEAGDVRSDAYVWHASLGGEALDGLRRQFGDALDGMTGLRRLELCSALRIRWLTDRKPRRGLGWASVPEWVARQLGGRVAAEYSLAARTGLFDVTERRWSPELVRWAGLDVAHMPMPLPAGTPLGTIRNGVKADDGAPVIVAGHDHLAASIGAGALAQDCAFDSFGTAEVVVRFLPRARVHAELADAVRSGCTRGPHVVGDRDYVFVGLDSGRALQDVLRYLGIPPEGTGGLEDAARRIDRAAAADLAARLFDPAGRFLPPAGDVPSALVWRSALEFTADRCGTALTRLDEGFGPRSSVVAAGGWYGSGLVREIRRRRIPDLRVPHAVEAGARGAARLAAVAAGIIPTLATWPDADATAGSRAT